MNTNTLYIALAYSLIVVTNAFGQMNGDEFFIGSNSFGELGPTYIASEDCLLTTPVTAASIGVSNMHAIIIANGMDDNGPVRLSQNVNELAVVDENSVSCNILGIHNGTSYYRQFAVSTVGNLNLTSIEIGVEVSLENSDGSGTDIDNLVPLQICLYFDTPVENIVHSGINGPSGFDESFCATVSGDNADNLTIVSLPIDATVPVGTQTLVVELFTPGRDTEPTTDFCLNNTGCDGQVGDLNMDGSVNLLDIGPFIDVLSNGQFVCEADTNEDGIVNLLDVNSFIDLISGS